MKKKNFIKIGKRKIGPEFKPLVIFELGINHNGSLKLAKKIVDAAISAGAEIIKHQTHIAEDEMSLDAKKIIPINAKKNIYDLIEDYSLSEKDELILKKYIEKKGAIFLSTPFSRKAADRLVKFKVKAFKIGSGECNNFPLVDYIASFSKPILISTGMNDLKSIKKSIKIIENRRVPYVILHTTNLYPTLHKEVRLNALLELKKFFPQSIIGLSDHTEDNYTSYAAVALGASVIEKHFVDKDSRQGPDIAASVNTKQMKELIKGVNLIYESLPGDIKPINREKKTAKFAFASVVSIKEIQKNEKFTRNNLWVKRPGSGDFLAKDYDKLLGKTAKKKIKSGVQIKKSYIK